MLLAAVLFAGCHDSYNDSLTADNRVCLRFDRGSSVSRLPVDASAVCGVSSDAGWIMPADGADSNGQVSIYMEENSSPETRFGTVSIMTADGRSVEYRIEQLGTRTGSRLPDSYGRTVGVGWGYDCNTYFADPYGVKDQIFNPVKIKMLADKYQGELFIEDESYNVVRTFRCVGSTSVEYSEGLAAEAAIDVGIPCAFSLEVRGRFSQSDMESGDYHFATYRHKKIISRRVMSLSNLSAAIESGEDVFTYGFKEYLRKLADSNGDADVIREFVDIYGNSFATVSEVGAKADYDMTVRKSSSVTASEVEVGVSAGFLSMFGMSMSETQRDVLTKIDEGRKFSLSAKGGDVTLLGVALLNGEQCDSLTLARWQDSVTEDNALMVGCSLSPIWELISDKDISNKVRAYITGERIVEDNLELPVPSLDRGRFAVPSFSEDGTLIKTAWLNGCPAVEFCDELIPEISTDHRVTVAYPIIDNSPVYSRGLFVGDGGIHPPGIIEWRGGECFYHAVSGQEWAGRLDSIYFDGGELTAEPAEDCVYDEGDGAADYCLEYYGEKYPLVKVGADVWMRECLRTLYDCNGTQIGDVRRDADGKYLYSGDGNSLLPVNWYLPTGRNVGYLNRLTATAASYLSGGVSGLDVEAVGNGGAEACYLKGSGAYLLQFYEMGEVEMKESSAYVPVRGVRSDKFRYY